jgi:3-hydroxyacyl-[acyl-carrier-protein] dehydratase
MTEDVVGGQADAVDIGRIMQMIPHRYPMLMIDRVVDIVSLESAVGIKNVTINEPQFQGHFPQRPIMPGVFIVEAMAQTAAVMVIHSLGAKAEGKLVYFISIDDCRFRRPVVPGDSMRIHIATERKRGKVWRFQGKAYVDEQLCSEARFAAMLVEE